LQRYEVNEKDLLRYIRKNK